VAASGGDRAVAWIGFPLLGAAAGWVLKLVAGWVAGLPWAPFQGPFKLVASIAEPYATIGSLVLGLAVGLTVAVIAERELLAVTVTDNDVTLVRGTDVTVAFERSTVDAAFMDGKKLILLGSSGEELAREGSDLPAGALAKAFQAHVYPWRADGDPYQDNFRLWVHDMPGLPPGANALLAARAKALAGRGDDAAALRTELLRLGVVVREEKRRQYWRQVISPPS
jgi:hypothetical protein